MKEQLRHVNQLKFDMKVYHLDIYKGNEPMEVVGIRKNEVELYGDWSGGMHCAYSAGWMPLKGVLIE